MRTADFDYDLPPELIAQHPLPQRSASRMMVVNRAAGAIEHRCITDLPSLLLPGDLMVLNDTRVIPARVRGTKTGTGGRVEVLFIEETAPKRWLATIKSSGKAKRGTKLELANGRLKAAIGSVGRGGEVMLDIVGNERVLDVLMAEGEPPLPPYIKRPGGIGPEDMDRYQTVYARVPGAVAAPTAGLHFTEHLFAALRERGVERTHVTLHVGPGTFRPVKTDTVEDHCMDAERYSISAGVADAISRAQNEGRRLVAVGTTTVRTLESAAAKGIAASIGRTTLFIYPPYEFRAVDVLLTNFHLPRSTLIMMVSAFAGRELVMEAYRQAVAEGYRFYSYGDCMLIV
jgi:S-adenosylmethionine:tRNA ribosyltransferase-isomerase